VATMHVAGAVPGPPVRLVVVAGTLTRARALERLLTAPGFALVGVARDPDTAERLVSAHLPAAVLVDLDLAAGGLEAIERIMATRATPIVVCGDAAGNPQDALAAGAVDVVGPLDAPAGTPDFAEALRRHLRMASRVPVITHPRARLRASSRQPERDAVRGHPAPADPRRRRPVVVAIGASTGGPPALATILRDLPADLDAAVLVVQHMAEGFLDGLARWLDEASPLRVVVAADGERLATSTVYLAPAATNMLLRPGHRVELTAPSVGQFHVPGVDATFHSVARVCGPRAVGVLLTGMGRDGAVGLRSMRDAGARTLGQDESTSVVWGMPAAARALQAVDRELPLSDVAAAVVADVHAVNAETAAAGGTR
jgi:two-component system, chemotaxis family, protein-glutamate methylesterase/glutaminase